MQTKCQKTGAHTPQSKRMVGNSSLSSLVTSSGHASPTSLFPPRPRFSTGRAGSHNNSAANVSFPSSVAAEDGRRPNPQRPNTARRGQKKKSHARPSQGQASDSHDTDSTSRPSKNRKTSVVYTNPAVVAVALRRTGPAAAAHTRSAKIAAAQNSRGDARAVAGLATNSGRSSSQSSSSKVVCTMKPPKQRCRRHRAERTKQNKAAPAGAETAVAEAPAAVDGTAAAPTQPSALPIAPRAAEGAASGGSRKAWMRQRPAHPVETLISNRYEDSARSPVVGRGGQPNSTQQTSSSATTAQAAAAAPRVAPAVGGVARSCGVGSPGVIMDRFPSRPDFCVDASVTSPLAALTVKSDTLSSSDFLLAPLTTLNAEIKDSAGMVAAAATVPEHLLPVTAGLSFPADPAAANGEASKLTALATSTSLAGVIELPSFPKLRTPAGAGAVASADNLLSVEDRQLSAVGLRVAAPAFQPRASLHTSPSVPCESSPTALDSGSRAPSMAAATPASSAPARNVINVVNTATGATQRHTPASCNDFPRTPASTSPAAAAPCRFATTSGTGDSPLLDAATLTAAARAGVMATSALHKDPTSRSPSVGEDTSFNTSSSSRHFPTLPPQPRGHGSLSRSASRYPSPLVPPAPSSPSQVVRHQHVTIARLVSAENEILSQLFDTPDEDDEGNQVESYSPDGFPEEEDEDDVVQNSWEVGSVVSFIGRGARRSFGAAYWHLDNGGGGVAGAGVGAAVREDEFPEDPSMRHSGSGNGSVMGGRLSASYTGAAGFWPLENYDASAADPDEYEDIWEVNSSAYEDSLDEAQVQWIEDQLRANENPEGFFF